MKTVKTRLLLPATVLACAIGLPAAASAEEAVIPPGNSAANQYTEAYPTPGGDKKSDEAATHRSPVSVLGGRNATKLQRQGPAGRAAASLAAATAPAPPPSADADGRGADRPGDRDSGSATRGDAAGDRAGAVGGAGGRMPASLPTDGGSSALSSAFEQATGLSSGGGAGLLLPAILLATILFSLWYWRAQGRRVGG